MPSGLEWSGAPALDWDDKTKTFAADKNYNGGLHVKVTSWGTDVGVAASLAQALAFYAAKAQDKDAKALSKELLDRIWAKCRDERGVSTPEAHKEMKRFNDAVFIPPGWKGKMPNGDAIDAKSTFLSIPLEVQRGCFLAQSKSLSRRRASPDVYLSPVLDGVADGARIRDVRLALSEMTKRSSAMRGRSVERWAPNSSDLWAGVSGGVRR